MEDRIEIDWNSNALWLEHPLLRMLSLAEGSWTSDRNLVFIFKSWETFRHHVDWEAWITNSVSCASSVYSTFSLCGTDPPQPPVVCLYFWNAGQHPLKKMAWFLSRGEKRKKESHPCYLRCASMMLCAQRSLFLGNCSNLTSSFHFRAHFIDWAVGSVGSLWGKVEEKKWQRDMPS